MAARLFLRAGEIATLYGEDSTRTEWSLWNELTQGGDNGAGDYGRWQSRLMTPIANGIAEDHSLRIQRMLTADDQAAGIPIMPPRAWVVAPTMLTGGESAVLFVLQKTSQSLREWKAPLQMPPKHTRRCQAIATAYGVEHVLLGVLVDGYSSQLFHVVAGEDVRMDIVGRAREFIRCVEDGDEPDVDFTKDASAVRAGIAVTKTEASTETVEGLLNERASLISRQGPIDTSLKQIEAKLRSIDTALIHFAGKSDKIEVGTRLVTITRDAKNTAKVTVTDRAAAPLF